MTTARADRRREQILESAARMFSEKGFHEAGIADIADDLKIGHGTVYRYFASKSDLADRIQERIVELIVAALVKEDPRASTTLAEYKAQVQRIVLRLFELVTTHPYLVRFFHRQAAVDLDRLAAAMDMFSTYTEPFLVNGVERGFLRAGLDTELSAQILVGALLDLLRRSAKTPPTAELQHRWLTSGVDLMFAGIAGPALGN